MSPGQRPFAIGDRVRPTAAWCDAQTPAIPAGIVRKVEPFGRGQVLWIIADPRPYVAGIFEREQEALDL